MTLSRPLAAPPQALPVRVALADRKLGVWDSLQASRRNVLSIIPVLSTRAPIVSGRTGTRWHMVTDPAANRRVLLENVEAYPKSSVTKNLLRPAVGESLFIAEGAHWRWQRRTAAPAFSHRSVTALAPVMSAAAARSADRLGRAEGAVDMAVEMVTATFDIISDVTFSGDASFDRALVHRAIENYLQEAGRIGILDVLGMPDWVPRPARLGPVAGTAEMQAMADRAVAERARRGPGPVPDLLDRLVEAADPETGRRMTPEEVRDNLLTFIVAGHETTALALAWSFYLLGFDEAAQERARDEALAVLGRGGVATAGDVDRLPFVRAVIDEALRLYPPGGMVSRTAQAEDTLCGRRIAPGETVILPIYALHRHVALWDAPDAFRPDRWLAGRPDRYAYLPFGDGPRICIGATFALQEAVIILATLLARFRFRAVAGRTPDPVMIITLRAEGGVWLRAEPL